MDAVLTGEEKYSTAITSSHLRVEADKPGDADYLIAAGWSKNQLGAALIRLHTEYDRTARKDGMSAMDAILMMGQLQSLKFVLGCVEWMAERECLEDAPVAAKALVARWLSSKCPVCNGRKFKLLPGGGLSPKLCKPCDGTGEAKIPHGESGRLIFEFITGSVGRANLTIKKAIHGTHYGV